VKLCYPGSAGSNKSAMTNIQKRPECLVSSEKKPVGLLLLIPNLGEAAASCGPRDPVTVEPDSSQGLLPTTACRAPSWRGPKLGFWFKLPYARGHIFEASFLKLSVALAIVFQYSLSGVSPSQRRVARDSVALLEAGLLSKPQGTPSVGNVFVGIARRSGGPLRLGC
jgi:hypothetical protein